MLKDSLFVNDGQYISPSELGKKFRVRNVENTRSIVLQLDTFNGYIDVNGRLGLRVPSGDSIGFGHGPGTSINFNASTGRAQLVGTLNSTYGRHFLFCDNTYETRDFDHPTQTNPTLFVHSVTDPDVDNTQWIGMTHDQTDPVVSWGKGNLKLTGPSGTVTLTKGGGTDLADAIVKPTTLKTAQGEVSITSSAGFLTLPGGECGFYPQLKRGAGATAMEVTFANASELPLDTYVTGIRINVQNGTGYARQRYMTASGRDHWLFALVEKSTGKILAAYSAPDHPCYGNGNNPATVPHPFVGNDMTGKEVVLIALKGNVTALKDRSKNESKSLLEIVNSEFVVDMSKEESYEPLHIGNFTERKVLVDKTEEDLIPVGEAKAGEEQQFTKSTKIVKVEQTVFDPVMLNALPSSVKCRKLKAKV